VLQLLGRTAAMRAVSLLGAVVLARILSPADFGIYAVVIAVVTVTGYLGDLGLSADLVRQTTEPTRRELATAWTAQQLLIGAGVLAIWAAAPVLFVVAPDLRPDAVWLLRVGSLALFFTGLRMLPQAMLARAMRFAPMALAEVLMQVAFYAVAITAALLSAGAWSFVLGSIAQTATSAVVVNIAWRSWPGVAIDAPTLRRLVRFGLPLQLSALVSWASENVITLAGALAGGLAGIGMLQFASRIAVLAAAIDEVIARVSFPIMSRLQDDPTRRSRAAGRVLDATTIAIVAIEGWLAAVAPSLVPLVFTEKWAPAIVPLQLMAVAAFATVPARMLRSLLWSMGRSDVTLRLALTIAAMAAVLAPVLVATLGLAGGGLTAVIVGGTSLVLHRRAASSATGGSSLRSLSIYASGAAAIVAGSAALSAAPGVVGLAIASAAFAVVYASALRVTSREQIDEALSTLRGRSSASTEPAA
jgi:O-antigen/teichoic acid export membrane protein